MDKDGRYLDYYPEDDDELPPTSNPPSRVKNFKQSDRGGRPPISEDYYDEDDVIVGSELPPTSSPPSSESKVGSYPNTYPPTYNPHTGGRSHNVPGAGGPTTLPLDVAETENEFVVKASLPGIKPEDVQIAVHGDTLTIRGESKAEEEKQGQTSRLRERRSGMFQRSLRLATPIDADKANARFKDGVLTLTLPKSEQARPKQIRIGGQ